LNSRSDFDVWLKREVDDYKKREMKHTAANISGTVNALYVYLTNHNINDVVIGISGGIDSSLVLAVLASIKKYYLPGLNIHAVNIHFSCYDGIFDFTYINELKEEYKDVNFYDINATKSIEAIFDDAGLDKNDKELMAQSSYALRYQILFTYAQKYSGITIGTTNKDEMSYVGWFGKNSDMVVDVQILHNYHKFEVIYWAHNIGVPRSIILRTPVGDLINRSSDEDNFGCSYDELAWYSAIGHKLEGLPFPLDKYMAEKFSKVEGLRKKNMHKYQGQKFNPIFL